MSLVVVGLATGRGRTSLVRLLGPPYHDAMVDRRSRRSSPLARTALRAGFFGAVYVAVAVVLVGCAMPMIRPMRVFEGPSADVGYSYATGVEESRGCDNEVGCVPGETGALQFIPPLVDARFGWVVADHLGLSAGAYLPGSTNNRGDWSHLGDSLSGLLVAHGTLTVQNDVIALGVSPEFGARVAGLAFGFDVQPFGHPDTVAEMWLPRATFYGRYLRPYDVDESVRENAATPGWDFGTTIRFGLAVFGVAHYRVNHGVIDYIVFETSGQAKAWTIFFVGGTLDLPHMDPLVQ